MRLTIILTVLLSIMTLVEPAAAARGTANSVGTHEASAPLDWASFLGRNDMMWPELPTSWDDGAFLGNGDLGTILWQDNDGSVRFEVSLSSLYDHRGNGPGKKDIGVVFRECRLPNGYFSLAIGSQKPKGDLRLDLWNAEARGQIVSGNATWRFRSFVPAQADLIVVELIGPENEKPPQLTWHPEDAISTRGHAPPQYVAYPPSRASAVNGMNVSVQEMPEDARYFTEGKGAGQYATAWLSLHSGGHFVYLISTKLSYPGRTAVAAAIDEVRHAQKLGIDHLEAGHRAWWHEYYPKSFLSVPDSSIESFYWIQMYKMASASRGNGPLVDLMGPWFRTTEWPAAWWNLNIQVTYWPFYMSNHLEEAKSLNRSLWTNRASLAANAAPYQSDSLAICRVTGPSLRCPDKNEIGNLPWVMQDLWLYYRYTMDDVYLREQLFPLMKGSFAYLWHLSVQRPDGSIVVPPSPSPEYTNRVENSSYSSACYRWLAEAIIEADTRLGTRDPIVERAKQVLASLVPYDIDPVTGVMVGKSMTFDHSHRHWSHLFMIYPFHEWDWSDPKLHPLMQKSLDHWVSMPDAFTGFSYIGAASMYADAGEPDEAVSFLEAFLRKAPEPNTLYREGSPVIETPLAFARAVQELMMTSYAGVIRIFPGVPEAWQDASFKDMRAEGAFLVSSVRRHGQTAFVTITSLAGEPCRVRTGLAGIVKADGKRTFSLHDRGDGIVEIDLAKGETAILYSGTILPDEVIQPVQRTGRFQPWGAVQAKEY